VYVYMCVCVRKLAMVVRIGANLKCVCVCVCASNLAMVISIGANMWVRV